jgi:hypothetical protein
VTRVSLSENHGVARRFHLSTRDIMVTYGTGEWFRSGLRTLVRSTVIVHVLTAERSNTLPPDGNAHLVAADDHDVAFPQLGAAPDLDTAVDVDFSVLDELLGMPAVLGELRQLEELS